MASFKDRLVNAVKSPAGATGKAVSAAGSFVSSLVGKDLRLGPSGSSLGASLQNWAGQNVPSPFVFINPPKAYSSETPNINISENRGGGGGGGAGGAGGDDRVAGMMVGGNGGGGGGQGIVMTPPSFPDTSSQDNTSIDLARGNYALARQGIEAQNPILDQSYTLAQNDINQSITDTENAGEAQKANLRQTYGDLLKSQLQTKQELDRQRMGTFSALGTLESSAFGEQQARGDQAFGEQKAKTEIKQVADEKSITDQVNSFVKQARGQLASLAIQYQAGKNAIAQALSQNNLDEASAINDAIGQIKQKASDIQNTMINFANQAQLLKAQGVNVRTGVSGVTGSDWASEVNQSLKNMTASGNSTYTLPTTTEGAGYIGPDGKKYRTYADYLRESAAAA